LNFDPGKFLYNKFLNRLSSFYKKKGGILMDCVAISLQNSIFAALLFINVTKENGFN